MSPTRGLAATDVRRSASGEVSGNVRRRGVSLRDQARAALVPCVIHNQFTAFSLPGRYEGGDRIEHDRCLVFRDRLAASPPSKQTLSRIMRAMGHRKLSGTATASCAGPEPPP
jgi:hypothetical protein